MDRGTEAEAGVQKGMLCLGRCSDCSLHPPRQTSSGARRLFLRNICISGRFTSTKDSLNLLQRPRESSINQPLVKAEAWGGGETPNENTAWQWWQGSDKKVNWSILLFTFYKLLSVSRHLCWDSGSLGVYSVMDDKARNTCPVCVFNRMHNGSYW